MAGPSKELEAKYPSQFDQIFSLVGSTWFLNYLGIIGFTLLNLLGLFLNLIGVVITNKLAKIYNSIGTYRYMRIYCLVGALANFVLFFGFMAYSKRLFLWTISVENFRFILFVYSPIVNVCYFYSALLDIFSMIDRIGSIDRKLLLIKVERINIVCLATFIIVLVLDIPYYINYEPSSVKVALYARNSNGSLYSNESVTWWITASTSFALSSIGYVLNIILSVFRDGFLALAEVLVNLLLLFYLRRHLSKKKKISASGTSSQKSNNETTVERKAAKSQLKLTKMVIVISVLSVLEHCMVIVAVLLPYVPGFSVEKLALFSCIGFFSISIKNTVTFFVLVAFNSKFRHLLSDEIKSILSLA